MNEVENSKLLLSLKTNFRLLQKLAITGSEIIIFFNHKL